MASAHEQAETFNVFDTTGVGTLRWEDVKNAIRSLGTPVSEEQLKSIEGEPGAIYDLATFQALYTKISGSLKPSDNEADLAAAFETIAGGSATVSKKMMKYYFTNVGETITEEEAEVLFAKAGDNIDLATFKSCILGT